MTFDPEVGAIDPYDLDRFVQAQAMNYEDALFELRAGKKRTHWMWYIFPQFAGLGNSGMSHRYSIKSEAEARAYIHHQALGLRLIDCATIVVHDIGRSAREIFGSPDDIKLRSSATLFARVSQQLVFRQIIDKYFGGKPDDRTLALLGANEP